MCREFLEYVNFIIILGSSCASSYRARFPNSDTAEGSEQRREATVTDPDCRAYYTKEGVLQFLNSNVVSYDREEVALYFAKLGISTYLQPNSLKKT